MMWKNKMVWENINIFSKEEAKKIENLFETNLHQFGLTVNHGSFRLSVYESTLNDTFPEIHKLIVNKIKKIPKLKDYNVTRSAGLRYTKDAPSMPHHYDGDDYTILIFINDNYEGSGTVFPLLKKTAHASEFGVGNALLFSGRKIKSWHGALPLKSGVRYTINVRLNKKKNFFLMVKSFFKLFEVISFGSIPKVIFFKIFFGLFLVISIILKFFPDSIFACKVYLPSTNKKAFFNVTTISPADPEKLLIHCSLLLCNGRNSF